MTDKPTLRREARRIRARLAETAPLEEFASAACHFFGGPLANWHGPRKAVVAGYWPQGSEFDTRPLLNYLREAGHVVALPVCNPVDLILHFRLWSPDVALEPDALGINAPPATAEVLAPDIVLVPLLAFTRRGERIGYGAGYYDATLEAIRRNRAVVAAGIAWAAQEVPEIPAEAHDQRLDWIVTEMHAQQSVDR